MCLARSSSNKAIRSAVGEIPMEPNDDVLGIAADVDCARTMGSTCICERSGSGSIEIVGGEGVGSGVGKLNTKYEI